MNLLKVGHVSNTHGLKGEIRILSNFRFKCNAFKPSNKLYIMGGADNCGYPINIVLLLNIENGQLQKI